MSSITERIRAAVEDGRAQSPRFKQRQLAALHEALKQNQTPITTAVEKDTKCSKAEANIQYYLTLDAVKSFYDKLDFKKLLEDEYSIAHLKDNPDQRSAIGCVNIIPDAQSLLYSGVVPTAAAIAAGNCVVLEIKQTLSELSTLLRTVLASTLDSDTFGVVDSDVLDQGFKLKHCSVLDCSKQRDQNVAALVDRSGDIEKAAKELVTARMSFKGRSRYAPDLVLVNEFCLEDFCKFAMQAALPYLASRTQNGHLANGHTASPKKTNTNEKGTLMKDANTSILSSGEGGSIALARDRTDKLLTTKINEPLLLIHPTSSLDDAIDFCNASSKEPLQALYLFGAPPAAKYVSQFVKADISFTNHIPIELLVGPVAPRTASLGIDSVNSLKAEVHPRFSPQMFSIPHPEFVSTAHSAISNQLTALVEGGNQQGTSDLAKLSEATQLKPLNEPEGGAIGFFEQGIITGGVLFLSTVMIGTATVVRYGYPYVVRMIKRS